MVAGWIVQRFDDHHARSVTLFRQMRPLLDPKGEADLPALARIRWALLRTLVEFQLFKHRDIFDPVIRLGTPSQQKQARALKEECAQLGADVRAFVTRWSNGSAGTAWADHRRQTIAILDRVERGLIDQRRAIVMLLLDNRAIILPAPPRAQPRARG
ncbi:hypothetical protein ASG67_14465 [Sphingomonas sp. Leaf339]|uniref:hemerythrin domain-containing protein n=1 Tax=Sphingomonas sp. Leaf339 TaxID=1736343 RepID=UPI0006F9F4BE|nr:hemerythrin domain-containing protein [Sphingomonas sp. Leaf339]KQU47450.1 hypothetical protein ASG67_14465 [Sphingomonas sp. Leaf339]